MRNSFFPFLFLFLLMLCKLMRNSFFTFPFFFFTNTGGLHQSRLLAWPYLKDHKICRPSLKNSRCTLSHITYHLLFLHYIVPPFEYDTTISPRITIKLTTCETICNNTHEGVIWRKHLGRNYKETFMVNRAFDHREAYFRYNSESTN